MRKKFIKKTRVIVQATIAGFIVLFAAVSISTAATTIGSDISTGGTLSVTGISTLTGATTIAGTATLQSTLDVTGISTLTGATTISGAATLQNTLTLTSTSNPQVTIKYDTGNYYTTAVSSAGAVTFNAVGGALANFNFSQPLVVATSTTNQLKISYDSTNFYTTTVSSAGVITFDATGSTLIDTFNFADPVKVATSTSSTLLTLHSTSATNATSTLGVFQAGTGPVAIFSGGNVGVGTTTPRWFFQVASSTNAMQGGGAALAISDTNAGANLKHWLISSMGGNMYIGTSSDAYATSAPAALTVTNAGKVGIGTANPSLFGVAKELVVSAGTSGNVITMLSLVGSRTTNNDFGSLAFSHQGSAANYAEITGGRDGADDAVLIRFSTKATGVDTSEKMRITSAGNVGIGTTTPLNIFSIRTGGSTAAASPSILYSASSTAAMWTANWIVGADLADQGKFKIASSTALGTSDRFVIDGSGKVGIGTSTPTVRLHVNDGATATTTIAVGDRTSGTGKSCFDLVNSAGTAVKMYINGTSVVVVTGTCD